ncbi:hypothetical protein ABKV19_023310 [Rosa sericea]
MGALVVKLVLIYSVLNAMFIFSCGSMQLNHPSTTRLARNETDRLALLAIKAQIRHDPNRVMSTWNDSTHFCLWQGVTCSRLHQQRVTRLDLNSQGLAGSLSPHIGNLSFLRLLRLYDNSFTHEIPPEIGLLRRLQILNLYNNSFTGLIPANISNCFNLIHLGVGRNKLVGEIPSKLGFLSKLERIVFENNNLTGEIPSSFGNLSSLTALAGCQNNLMGSIRSSLCHLKKLFFFSLGLNMLSGTIPSCIYNLSAIVTFGVEVNKIQGSIPSDWSNAFPNIEVFDISENEFTGAITSSISNATSLVGLRVSDNHLSGQVPNLLKLHNLTVFSIEDNYLGSGKQGDLSFVSELINATRLERLFFGYNNFGGTLPISISNISTNLEKLSVGGNELHGSIPTGLGNLVSLQLLALSENFFTSNIPAIDIGKLSRLEGLDFANNKLSGSIPSSLGNLTMLSRLELQGNYLNGSTPSRLGECHTLLQLDLSQNNLQGKIPQELLIGLYSSISFNLSRNNFTGSLPLEIGKLKNLGALDISNNLLSGVLPSSLGNCESLEVLHLQGNYFKGSIPSSMKKLRGIQDVDLSRNNLSGEIPQFLEGFAFLKNLNLSFNQFSGAVPTEGVFKNANAISIVGNARLCGGLTNLQLPKCNSAVSKGGGLSRRLKMIISSASAFAFLGIAMVLSFVFFSSSRTKNKETALAMLGNSTLQLSYTTLSKATDGFSSANLIGVGAFGSVYKGTLADDRVVVAVKVLNMLHRGAAKSFMAECEALRNIRHRNLVKILTACSSIDFGGNDFKALVYEFMDNGSLEEWLHLSTRTGEVTEAPKLLSLIQRLKIAIDVASALDYLHNHCETPIVHCDLKTSNVLLDGDLTGHVSDFGLSRFLSEPTMSVSGNQSSSIGIRGSVGYAAPEYGMGSEVSTYGDVYSFGILLLEMFTGKRPTDHMFSDSLNLHNYVKTALPELVSEISESLILQEGTTNVTEAHRHSRLSVRAQKIEECLTLILGIGIACSVESPTNRKDISDAASELQSIRRNLLN